MNDLAALDIEHFTAGGIYAKRTTIYAGQILTQHRHKHDHMSILASGRVTLQVDGYATVLHAPACVTIEAHKHHMVKAHTDSVWFCIWPDNVSDDERTEAPTSDMRFLASSML